MNNIKRLFEKLLPELSYAKRKGQNGKMGIIGGSFEYIGAPYYSAMAQLRAVK
jgi:ATP-dependent NAD(P)H-hydrate dehydratase